MLSTVTVARLTITPGKPFSNLLLLTFEILNTSFQDFILEVLLSLRTCDLCFGQVTTLSVRMLLSEIVITPHAKSNFLDVVPVRPRVAWTLDLMSVARHADIEYCERVQVRNSYSHGSCLDQLCYSVHRAFHSTATSVDRSGPPIAQVRSCF